MTTLPYKELPRDYCSDSMNSDKKNFKVGLDIIKKILSEKNRNLLNKMLNGDLTLSFKDYYNILDEIENKKFQKLVLLEFENYGIKCSFESIKLILIRDLTSLIVSQLISKSKDNNDDIEEGRDNLKMKVDSSYIELRNSFYLVKGKYIVDTNYNNIFIIDNQRGNFYTLKSLQGQKFLYVDGELLDYKHSASLKFESEKNPLKNGTIEIYKSNSGDEYCYFRIDGSPYQFNTTITDIAKILRREGDYFLLGNGDSKYLYYNETIVEVDKAYTLSRREIEILEWKWSKLQKQEVLGQN